MKSFFLKKKSFLELVEFYAGDTVAAKIFLGQKVFE